MSLLGVRTLEGFGVMVDKRRASVCGDDDPGGLSPRRGRARTPLRAGQPKPRTALSGVQGTATSDSRIEGR